MGSTEGFLPIRGDVYVLPGEKTGSAGLSGRWLLHKKPGELLQEMLACWRWLIIIITLNVKGI